MILKESVSRDRAIISQICALYRLGVPNSRTIPFPASVINVRESIETLGEIYPACIRVLSRRLLFNKPQSNLRNSREARTRETLYKTFVSLFSPVERITPIRCERINARSADRLSNGVNHGIREEAISRAERFALLARYRSRGYRASDTREPARCVNAR